MEKLYKRYESDMNVIASFLKQVSFRDKVYITENEIMAETCSDRIVRIIHHTGTNDVPYEININEELYNSSIFYGEFIDPYFICKGCWESCESEKEKTYSLVINNDYEYGFCNMTYEQLCHFIGVSPVDFDAEIEKLLEIPFPEEVRNAVCLEHIASNAAYTAKGKRWYIFEVYRNYAEKLALAFESEMLENEPKPPRKPRKRAPLAE